ncbi:hypothetical protein K491DRAFT_716536 [Lophiostoma macrostomum CBS 122681]|uniref:DUF7730 domain-containing protein n=1 Tax=Lophiostoma macrostomum CBS 122681 TaxID=1314788 RepID=A0A6A6T8A0_9PLEO|nr:hypothetical protein K491DRAFT_716536 [Lophiostoma macrostomum CBS 122681]
MGKCQQQLQSPLFARLPAEIRLEIYQAVLGDSDRVTKVFHSDDRLHYARCPPYRHKHTAEERQNRRLLSLLQACKAIHSEAYKMLYTANPFQLMAPMHRRNTTFVTFIQSLRTDCLISIRHLELHCTFASLRYVGARSVLAGNMDYWKPVCTQLQKMAGLETLELTIKIDSGPWIPPKGSSWFFDVFNPLLPVRVPRFVVRMGFDIPQKERDNSYLWNGGDLQFELVVDQALQPLPEPEED